MKTIFLWPKTQLQIALSHKNKQNRILYSILTYQNLLKLSTSNEFYLQTCANEH